MESALILNESDIKKILAEYYKVDEKDIIKAKYSYIIQTAKVKHE